ncbi:MAG: PorT family protein [Bacteroidia bacterium]|nr:PorT family protein [Bacteroidia bacterium]MDW8058276.1 outer membrane beta-barrel protein [Bacteroidia bacterium]
MRWCLLYGIGIGLLFSQEVKPTWFAPRVGINWGQYRTKSADIVSRSYWGGGLYGGLALQRQLDSKGRWALQGEIGTTQRRSTDRNLIYDYRYNIWSADIALLGVWRWVRKFEALFIEAGPSSSLLLYGKYWERNNLTGEVERRRVEFGRKTTSDVRRGELALNIGMGAGYLAGPGYLTFGLRFWHGINNLGSGQLFQRWNNYGVLMSLSYWYDDSLRE